MKKLFGKPDAPPGIPTLSANTERRYRTAPVTVAPSPAPDGPPLATSEPLEPLPPVDADALSITYGAILKQVGTDLRGRLVPPAAATSFFPLARDQVLAQLAHGSVKVPFRDLRRHAPAGVFTDSSAHDHELVSMPLGEILAQLHPDAYARRANQTRVQVPEGVLPLFGPKGDRPPSARVIEKDSPPAEPAPAVLFRPGSTARPPISPATPAPAPAPVRAPAAPAAPAAPLSQHPAVGVPLPPHGAYPIPSKPVIVTSPNPLAGMAGPKVGGAPGQPLPAVRRPTAPIIATLPTAAVPPATGPVPVAHTFSSLAADLVDSPEVLLIGLADLADEWPSGIRQEIAQLKTPNPQCALPLPDIGEAMKLGFVRYPWKQLRAWITPEQFFDTDSPHGEVVLDLPLRIVAPLYLDKTRGTTFFKKASYADTIPDVFNKGEAPAFAVSARSTAAPGPHPAPVPAATPQPIRVNPGPVAVPLPSPTPMAVLPAAPVSILSVKVNEVAGQWPEGVRQEIAEFALEQSELELPIENVETDLKFGKLVYPWRQLQVWLNPPPPASHTSPHADTYIELPLAVITPLFLEARPFARRRDSGVPASIPDLFSAAESPPPATPSVVPSPLSAASARATLRSGPATQPASMAASLPSRPISPLPAPDHESLPGAEPGPRSTAPGVETLPVITVLPPKKEPTTLGELFGEAEKEHWSPNEIVQRTSAMEGVSGSMIALADGLLVASSMPAALKTETIAAFLPQIFGRASQYARELQLGEVQTMNLTVQPGTLQIFKSGTNYFAVMGRTGTTLPMPALTLIAAELGKQNK